MAVEVKLKGNVNKLADQAVNLLKEGIQGLRVDQALIYNNSKENVTFYVYNYIDSVFWVSAMKVLVAPGKSGTVSASGAFFKIHPNDNKDEEFLVAPFKAYIYSGPGQVDQIEKA